MSSPELWLRNLHVIANLFWIGSIVAVGVLLGAAGSSTTERAKAALLVYRRLAVPAFGISFLAGATRLALNLDYYLVQTHFMHAKLPLALGAIALHHVLGARARRAAGGQADAVKGAPALTAALAACAILAAWFVLAKPF